MKVYAYIGILAGEEINKCNLHYIGNNCTELLIDNRNIFEGYLLYLIVVAAHIFILLSASLLEYYVLCNSGQNIHDCSVAGVIQAPIRFFDLNPAGRILNRFRKIFNFIQKYLSSCHCINFFHATFSKIIFKVIIFKDNLKNQKAIVKNSVLIRS